MGEFSDASVLVVDDDPITLRVISKILRREGFAVRTRDQALGTVVEILRTEPDFVLLDVEMPALKGDQIARVLNRGNRRGHTRIIFHSSCPESQLATLASLHQAQGWIHKTSDHRHFLAEFRRVIRARPSAPAHAEGF